MINLLKSLEIFIKRIFAKRIFLNPFKTQFEIKASRGAGKTTACVKFAKRMIRKKKTVIWIVPRYKYIVVLRHRFSRKAFPKIVFFAEQGDERTITDILYSRQLFGRNRDVNNIVFVIDEVLLLRTPAIHKFVKEFCKRRGLPYIFTST